MREGYPKRRSILEAAAKVFAAKGFYRATIEEIAQEAGVGKGTVYEYFRSKEELFERLLREGGQSCLAPLRESLAQVQSVRAKLELIFTTYLRFAYHHRDLFRLVFVERHPLGESFFQRFREERQEKLKALEGLLAEGMAARELGAINPRLAASVVFGSLVALAHQLALAEIDVQPDGIPALAGQAVDLLWPGLKRQATPEEEGQ